MWGTQELSWTLGQEELWTGRSPSAPLRETRKAPPPFSAVDRGSRGTKEAYERYNIYVPFNKSGKGKVRGFKPRGVAGEG